MKKGTKFFKTVLVTMAVVLGLGTVAYAEGTEVTPVAEENVVFDYEGSLLTIDDVTYFPVRYVFEALGYDVLWDAENEAIAIANDDQAFLIAIGEAETFNVASEEVTELSAPVLLVDETTYAPVDLLEVIGIEDADLVITAEEAVVEEVEEEKVPELVFETLKLADFKLYEKNAKETISVKRYEPFTIALPVADAVNTWTYKVDLGAQYVGLTNTGFVKTANVLGGEAAQVWTFYPEVQGTYLFTFTKGTTIVKFLVDVK